MRWEVSRCDSIGPSGRRDGDGRSARVVRLHPEHARRSQGARSAPQSSEATAQVALGGTRRRASSPTRETSPPALASREFELPPGTEVTDYTHSLAAFSQYGREYPHAVFGLLNLTSGRRRLVLRAGVNEARGYNTVAPRISDSWMVWEEVSPNETFEPDKTTWRLYAAPVGCQDARRSASRRWSTAG